MCMEISDRRGCPFYSRQAQVLLPKLSRNLRSSEWWVSSPPDHGGRKGQQGGKCLAQDNLMSLWQSWK